MKKLTVVILLVFLLLVGCSSEEEKQEVLVWAEEDIPILVEDLYGLNVEIKDTEFVKDTQNFGVGPVSGLANKVQAIVEAEDGTEIICTLEYDKAKISIDQERMNNTTHIIRKVVDFEDNYLNTYPYIIE